MQKVVVITGASSGIGRAAAGQMARAGYKVYDFSRSDKPQDGVTHVACDVTKREVVKEAVKTVADREGRIDILILCAGFGVAGSLEFTTDDEMLRQYDVNVFGPVRVVQEALPVMRSQEKRGRERGRIVFVGSMAGVFGIPFQGMYSATKAAIHNYAFSLANEVKDYCLTVTCLMPGDVHTGFGAARQTTVVGNDVYPSMGKAIGQMESDELNGLSADECARRLVKAATSKCPALYYTSDFISSVENFLSGVVRANFARKIVGMMYKC